MIVIDIKTGQPHQVWKYLLSGDGQESIWFHDWYGHHVIGIDCVFPYNVEYSSTPNNELVIPPPISNTGCKHYDNCDNGKISECRLRDCFEAD
jgi:hypothetical protein